MSERSAKRLRRAVKKQSKDIFYEHVIEISIMPFFKRLWYCLKMAFNCHGLQKQLKDNIAARRKFTAAGKVISNAGDNWGLLLIALASVVFALLLFIN